MTTRSLARLALLGPLVLAGLSCRGAPPVPGPGPAANPGGAASPRPADCPLEFLYRAPARPHEALRELQVQVMSQLPGGAVEALRPGACAAGADAVIVTRNQVLNLFDQAMVEGTAIRYLPATPPATPLEVAPPRAAPPDAAPTEATPLQAAPPEAPPSK